MKKRTFTLIELIAVIVILGLISVVAIPKFVNAKAEAAQTQADGVFGAAQSAASLNYAKGLLEQASHTEITTGQTLLDAMENEPEGWTASGTTITATLNGTVYTITVGPVEQAGNNPATLTASWITP